MLRALAPDMPAVARMDRSGVIVTAPGDGAGSALSVATRRQGHRGRSCDGLCPLHARALLGEKAGKSAFRAFQASPRGGEIICRLAGDRVELEGCCVFYLEGQVEI